MEHNHPPKKLTLSGQTDKKLQHARHEHDNHPHENHKHDFRSYERKRLLITIILTGTMMIAEILGGIFTGSLALISDAGHMLTHAFALLVSFLAILYACRPATKDKSFGFYRAEILAALLNGITLLVITGFILWEAYKRILNPRPIAAKEMIIIGVVGLLVNIATALLLWKASKESLNVRSAFIHMLGDTGSSVGVVIGAFIIYFTGFYIIDPIFSIIIAMLILIWSISLIRDSIRILMESTPKNINVGGLKAGVIAQNVKVKDIHDLHVWEITSNMYCMTAHMVIEDMNVSQTQQLLDEISQYLWEKYNIQHPIIQFETGGGFDHKQGCNLDKPKKLNQRQ